MKKVLIAILVFLAVIVGGGAIAYHTSPTFKDWTDKNILKHEQVVDNEDETTSDETAGDETTGAETTGDETAGA